MNYFQDVIHAWALAEMMKRERKTRFRGRVLYIVSGLACLGAGVVTAFVGMCYYVSAVALTVRF